MQMRAFRVLRRKYGIPLTELARACGVSEQRMSELELSVAEVKPSTLKKLQAGFEQVMEHRQTRLCQMQRDFDRHKCNLLDLVEELSYEL